MEFKKQFKEEHPETIGETDSHFDKSNYIDWIDKEYAQLQADKEELLEALEELQKDIKQSEVEAKKSAEKFDERDMEVSHYCSKAMETAYSICGERIELILQKHKQ